MGTDLISRREMFITKFSATITRTSNFPLSSHCVRGLSHNGNWQVNCRTLDGVYGVACLQRKSFISLCEEGEEEGVEVTWREESGVWIDDKWEGQREEEENFEGVKDDDDECTADKHPFIPRDWPRIGFKEVFIKKKRSFFTTPNARMSKRIFCPHESTPNIHPL